MLATTDVAEQRRTFLLAAYAGLRAGEVLDVKTACLYICLVPLLNVRLSPDDARRAAELREQGVQISDVVREAIRAEYLRRRPGGPGNRRPSLIVKEILAALPDPAEAPPARVVDPADRHAVRRHIAARLRGRGE